MSLRQVRADKLQRYDLFWFDIPGLSEPGDRMILNPRGPSNPNGKESFAFAYVNNRSESGAWLSFGLELPKGLATWKIGS